MIVESLWSVVMASGRTARVFSPREAQRRYRHGNAIAIDDHFGLANSYRNTIGREPGEAWVLLRSTDVDTIAASSNPVTIRVSVKGAGGLFGLSTIQFNSMYLDWADSIHPYSASTRSSAIYLCRFVDARQRLKLSAINAQFNMLMRSPTASSVASANAYYTESLNSGSLYTWQTLFDTIWAAIPTGGALSPTLPRTPTAIPVNIALNGVNAWDAYNDLLERHGMCMSWNPFTASLLPVDMTTFQASKVTTSTSTDYRYMTYQSGERNGLVQVCPESVRVYFRVIDQWLGEERDTPRDTNWLSEAVHEITVATGIAGAGTGTIIPVWDDMPALRNTTSESFTNSADLTTRANEIAAGIAATIYQNRYYANCKRWFGYVIESTGPACTSVMWKDTGDNNPTTTSQYNDQQNPVVTRFAKYLGGSRLAATGDREEAITGHGHIRFGQSEAVHPQLPQFVKVIDETETLEYDVSEVNPNSSDLITGKVVLRRGGAIVELENCWIVLPENIGKGTSGDGLVMGAIYHARLAGSATYSGDFRPVYLVEHRIVDARWILFQLTADLSATDAFAASTLVDYYDGSYPGETPTIHNLPDGGGGYLVDMLTGDRGYAFLDTNDMVYRAVGSLGVALTNFKAPYGGIPGRVGPNMGSAVCDKYQTSSAGVLSDTGDDITVYNWASSAVCDNGDRYGVASRINGVWVVISEDCGDEGSTIISGSGTYSSGSHGDAFDLAVSPAFGTSTSGTHTFTSGLIA